MWNFSPPIDDQNQNANNLPLNNNAIQSSNDLPLNNNAIRSSNVNKNPVQTSNVKHRMSSDCLAIPSSVGCDPTMSSSSSKTLINCDDQNFFNSCPNLFFNGTASPVPVPTAISIIYHNVIKATSLPSFFLVLPQPAEGGAIVHVASPVQKVCGTNDDDYIVGSEGDDIIFGLLGNDVISALGGDDLVFGGPGDDIVYGNDGNNQLFGDVGNDNLVGGINDDLLVGGLGNDRLYGNTGDDILQGGPGADYFDCGDGVDSVIDYNPSQGDVVSTNCENVNTVH